MRYSTEQTAVLARCSRRQVDHLVRQGIVRPNVPPRGSGSRMGFDARDVAVVGALVALRRLGAPLQTLVSAADTLTHLEHWSGRVLVTERGQLIPLDDWPNVPRGATGWMIDLGTLPRLMAA